MAGYEPSTEQLTAVTDCRNLTAQSAVADEFPVSDLEPQASIERDGGRRLAAFAAGLVLVAGAVAGLHTLYRAGDGAADLISWAGLLLLGMTALGSGIKLAMWGAQPVTAAVFDASTGRLSRPAQAVVAVLGVIAGAVGMWFTFRGGYTSWWQKVTGEQGWSLLLGVGQMLVAVLAGAALFAGGKFLARLAKDAFDSAGEHRHTYIEGGADTTASHPALVAALIAGGAGLTVMTAWLVPTLAPTITGPTVLPAIAAIAVVLVVAVGSNLGWWKGLAGLYAWAIDTNQKAGAIAGVVALLMFSAGGLGLGWFTPATVPVARAACPPDCGGGGGLDGPPGGGSQFRPPDMPASQPDYSSGNYGRPPLDQNSGISIYNENPAAGQVPSQTGGQQSMQEPPFRANPDGSWQARNGEWSPPNYQTATPGLTQGPGRPNPDWTGNQGTQTNPGSQGGNQGAQQPAQQPQQPQENPGQQPNEQPQQSDSQRIDDMTRQLQDQQRQSGQDRQRIDELTKHLNEDGKQKQQQMPRFSSKDDKKDRDQQEQRDRDQQSGNNDLAALLMGAASTRRRKQDEQQGPDTQALAQDASQAAQGLPGDVQTYVQSGQQIAESSGQAAQGFGSAAQAGASLASSAQSGAVNPQDAITVVQGVSQGIQGTADAVNSGSQIVKTAQGQADQVAQAVGDANPQLKPQTEQFTQLNDQASQVTDMVGQGAQLTSQASGAVNTFSGMGSGGMPDTGGASDLLSEGGTTTPMSGGSDGSGMPAPGRYPNTPTGGSRADAVAFAERYAKGWGADAMYYNPQGNDCTNYVSYALREGGFTPADPYHWNVRTTDQWFNTSLKRGTPSAAWDTASGLYTYISNGYGTSSGGPVGNTLGQVTLDPTTQPWDPKYLQNIGMQPGDVILYNWNGGEGISHSSMYVTQGSFDDTIKGVGDLVDYHTNDTQHHSWALPAKDENGNVLHKAVTYTFIHMKYPGE